jgi:hypothetical protein
MATKNLIEIVRERCDGFGNSVTTAFDRFSPTATERCSSSSLPPMPGHRRLSVAPPSTAR